LKQEGDSDIPLSHLMPLHADWESFDCVVDIVWINFGCFCVYTEICNKYSITQKMMSRAHIVSTFKYEIDHIFISFFSYKFTVSKWPRLEGVHTPPTPSPQQIHHELFRVYWNKFTKCLVSFTLLFEGERGILRCCQYRKFNSWWRTCSGHWKK
jgi:hypothetical protein